MGMNWKVFLLLAGIIFSSSYAIRNESALNDGEIVNSSIHGEKNKTVVSSDDAEIVGGSVGGVTALIILVGLAVLCCCVCCVCLFAAVFVIIFLVVAYKEGIFGQGEDESVESLKNEQDDSESNPIVPDNNDSENRNYGSINMEGRFPDLDLNSDQEHSIDDEVSEISRNDSIESNEIKGNADNDPVDGDEDVGGLPVEILVQPELNPMTKPETETENENETKTKTKTETEMKTEHEPESNPEKQGSDNIELKDQIEIEGEIDLSKFASSDEGGLGKYFVFDCIRIPGMDPKKNPLVKAEEEQEEYSDILLQDYWDVMNSELYAIELLDKAKKEFDIQEEDIVVDENEELPEPFKIDTFYYPEDPLPDKSVELQPPEELPVEVIGEEDGGEEKIEVSENIGEMQTPEIPEKKPEEDEVEGEGEKEDEVEGEGEKEKEVVLVDQEEGGEKMEIQPNLELPIIEKPLVDPKRTVVDVMVLKKLAFVDSSSDFKNGVKCCYIDRVSTWMRKNLERYYEIEMQKIVEAEENSGKMRELITGGNTMLFENEDIFITLHFFDEFGNSVKFENVEPKFRKFLIQRGKDGMWTNMNQETVCFSIEDGGIFHIISGSCAVRLRVLEVPKNYANENNLVELYERIKRNEYIPKIPIKPSEESLGIHICGNVQVCKNFTEILRKNLENYVPDFIILEEKKNHTDFDKYILRRKDSGKLFDCHIRINCDSLAPMPDENKKEMGFLVENSRLKSAFYLHFVGGLGFSEYMRQFGNKKIKENIEFKDFPSGYCFGTLHEKKDDFLFFHNKGELFVEDPINPKKSKQLANIFEKNINGLCKDLQNMWRRRRYFNK